MKKIMITLLTFFLLFTLHQSVSAEGKIDYEANIDDFVNNPNSKYRIDELIQNDSFKYVLGRFLGKDSDDEITWNELNEAINENNGDFDSYMDLYLNEEGDTEAFKIFKNTKVTALPWITLTYDKNLDFLDPTTFPELKKLHLTGHSLTHADLAGFSKLESLVISGDDIAYLDISDSTQLKELLITAGKIDTFDVSHFNKLEELQLSGMNLKTLDLTGLHNLKELWIERNTFGSIDLKGLQKLEYLRFVSNDIKSLELINLPKLTEVWLEENTLESLIIKNSSSLKHIYHHNFDTIRLKSLELNKLARLDYIDLRGTKLRSIDVSNVPSLTALEIDGSKLESIDVSQLCQLETLMISDSRIQSIDLSGLSKLTRLTLANNELRSIDLSDQIHLEELFLNNNNLNSIDLTGLNKLSRINIANNDLETIDLSSQTKVIALYLENNNLKSLAPVQHLLDFEDFSFFNIHGNKINLHSLKNKPIHERLLKKLDKAYDVIGAAYKYHDQSLDYSITIGGEKVSLNGGDVMNITGTESAIVFPDDLPQGTNLDIKVLSHSEKSDLLAGTAYELAGDMFQFLFDNSIEFDGKFKLILGYDKNKFKADEVAIYYYNSKTKKWEAIGGYVDAKNGTITAEVDHFSIYGVLSASKTANVGHEKDVTEEKDENGTKVNDAGNKGKGKTGVSEQQDGNKLPKTATNAFNFLALGAVLMVVGIGTAIYRRKAL